MKWFDKAQPSAQNHYEKISNPSGSGLYNTHFMNGLNTVYFEPNCSMHHHAGGIAFPFQQRTFFAVIKCRSDLSDPSGNAFLNFFGGGDTGQMQTGITYISLTGLFQYNMCTGGVDCGVVFDLSNNPLNQKGIIMFAQSETDLSGNEATYDTISQPLSGSTLAASYSDEVQQYYLNNPGGGNSLDIAEIIMYGRCIDANERKQVVEYLADKWNLSGASNTVFE